MYQDNRAGILSIAQPNVLISPPERASMGWQAYTHFERAFWISPVCDCLGYLYGCVCTNQSQPWFQYQLSWLSDIKGPSRINRQVSKTYLVLILNEIKRMKQIIVSPTEIGKSKVVEKHKEQVKDNQREQNRTALYTTLWYPRQKNVNGFHHF